MRLRSRVSRLETLFERAIALSAEARASFLDTSCGADADLRRELASLVAAHDASEGYFEELGREVLAPALAAVAAEPEDDVPPADADFPYRILGRIGAGGMGVVYKALDLRLERTVALKFVSAHLAQDGVARARLHAEARAASALDHPHIGVIHEIGETRDGRMFIVMAHYEGRTLQETIADAPLPPSAAVDLAMQLARALAAVHRRSIVHRDVKPSNIFVTGEGVAKLLDFGVAKISGGDAVRDGAPGTVAYMSPEQTRGETVDARTDLWSLGVVIHEMLTGRHPFARDDEPSTIEAIRTGAWQEREPSDPALPAPLAAIVGRCLETDGERRYRHAEELLEELQAYADDVRAAEGTGRAGRRLPRTIARAAALVVAFAAGVLLLAARGDAPSDAERFYRVGRFYLDQGDVAPTTLALEYFERALNADPEYARAWAGSADAHREMAVLEMMSPRVACDTMRTHAEMALAIDPRLPEAHVSMAMVLAECDLDMEESARHLHRALDLDETYPPANRQYAVYLRMFRDFDRALYHLAEAEKHEPYWRTNLRERGVILYMRGDYEDALVTLLRYDAGLDSPLDDRISHLFLALTYVQLGRYEDALRTLDREWPENWRDDDAVRGYIYAVQGKHEAARQVIAALEEKSASHWFRAIIHLGLGEVDRAIDLLWEAYHSNTRQIRLVPVEPVFNDLRGKYPLFDELVEMVRGERVVRAASGTR